MPPITSRWIAAASCLLALEVAEAARRPRYGGTLRIQMQSTFTADPAEWPADPVAAAAKAKVVNQVFETLVRLDEKGEPQPLLAVSWKHDAASKQWIFTPRPNVTLHNGAAWTPPGGRVAVPDDRPIADILRNLADPRNAVVVRAAEGSLLGTGPLRLERIEPGRDIVLTAHDAHWEGRPYLDTVEIQMGRAPREQLLDLELGRADVIEVPLTELRRIRQRGGRVVHSASVEVLALTFDAARPAPETVRQALALSIDHTAIHNVLLQKQGEISGALLPQWLSGYAFLFAPERDLARARQLASPPPALTFAYDRQDALVRSIAERIALNAGEAGITLRPAAGASADVQLGRLRITAPDPQQALADLAAALRFQLPATISEPFDAERSLLEGFRVLPLFHLPAAYQVSGRVRNWPESAWMRSDRWQLADVWLDERDRP